MPTLPDFLWPNDERRNGGFAEEPLPLDQPRFQELASFMVPAQEQQNWCWAAIAQSTASYYQSDASEVPSQCEIATLVLLKYRKLADGQDCCSGFTEVCDQDAKLSDALVAVQTFGKRISGSVPFYVIKKEIDEKRPVACHIRLPPEPDRKDPVGHFLAVSGYLNEGNRQLIVVWDPYGSPDDLTGNRTEWSYARFATFSTGEPYWDHSYLTRRGTAVAPVKQW